MRRARFGGAGVTLALAFVASCGDSTSDQTSDAGSAGGQVTTGGASGVGGASGTTGGSSGTGGTGGNQQAGGSPSPDASMSATGSKQTGEPCTTSNECDSRGLGAPFCFTDWPGGYCSSDCVPDCPTLGKCSMVDALPKCIRKCESIADCRAGYACTSGVCKLP